MWMNIADRNTTDVHQFHAMIFYVVNIVKRIACAAAQMVAWKRKTITMAEDNIGGCWTQTPIETHDPHIYEKEFSPTYPL